MKLIFILFLSLAIRTACAQSLASAARPLSGSIGMAFLFTADGKQAGRQNPDITGTPFFTENWCNTNLQLVNGDVFNVPKAKLEIMNNQLHFIDSRGEQMYLDARELKRVEFMVDSVLYSFRIHPGVKDNITAAFYEVLSEGRITLLKRVKKLTDESRNSFTQEVKKEIVMSETACVFFNDTITPVKFRESFWQPMMENKWGDIKAYMAKNDLSFKSLDNVKKAVVYYNAAQ